MSSGIVKLASFNNDNNGWVTDDDSNSNIVKVAPPIFTFNDELAILIDSLPTLFKDLIKIIHEYYCENIVLYLMQKTSNILYQVVLKYDNHDKTIRNIKVVEAKPLKAFNQGQIQKSCTWHFKDYVFVKYYHGHISKYQISTGMEEEIKIAEDGVSYDIRFLAYDDQLNKLFSITYDLGFGLYNKEIHLWDQIYPWRGTAFDKYVATQYGIYIFHRLSFKLYFFDYKTQGLQQVVKFNESVKRILSFDNMLGNEDTVKVESKPSVLLLLLLTRRGFYIYNCSNNCYTYYEKNINRPSPLACYFYHYDTLYAIGFGAINSIKQPFETNEWQCINNFTCLYDLKSIN